MSNKSPPTVVLLVDILSPEFLKFRYLVFIWVYQNSRICIFFFKFRYYEFSGFIGIRQKKKKLSLVEFLKISKKKHKNQKVQEQAVTFQTHKKEKN